MGRINEVRSENLEELVAKIRELPDALRGEVHERGLDAAGEILAEYQRGSLQTEGLLDTKQLMDSISVYKHKGYVEVYPSGKRSGGENNATVGFVLEHGRTGRKLNRRRRNHIGGGLEATHWMSKAVEAAADDIEAAVLEIYDDVLSRLL